MSSRMHNFKNNNKSTFGLHRSLMKSKSNQVWREDFKKQCLQSIKKLKDQELNKRRGILVDSEPDQHQWIRKIVLNEWKKLQTNDLIRSNKIIQDINTSLEEEFFQEIEQEEIDLSYQIGVYEEEYLNSTQNANTNTFIKNDINEQQLQDSDITMTFDETI
nr:6198_t:CDS:2 [Entrophospora candida]CAG8452660.1 10364_t:CDS:2 [Entrophospora candida]